MKLFVSICHSILIKGLIKHMGRVINNIECSITFNPYTTINNSDPFQSVVYASIFHNNITITPFNTITLFIYNNI